MIDPSVWLGIKIFLFVISPSFFILLLFFILNLINEGFFSKIADWLEDIVDRIFDFFMNLARRKKKLKIKKRSKVRSLTEEFLNYEKYQTQCI
jgi:hypothetical protein